MKHSSVGMTTITQPSGHGVVAGGNTMVIDHTGKIFYEHPRTGLYPVWIRFVPSNPPRTMYPLNPVTWTDPSLVCGVRSGRGLGPSVWLDSGSVNGGSVARTTVDPGDAMDEDDNGEPVPRATPAITLSARTGTSTFTIPAGATYVVDRQAARNVLAFGGTFPGMTGTWGPLDARWTVMVLFRIDQLVNDFGTFLGMGTGAPNLIASSTITIAVPSGGSVPAAALLANGGPLDGVEAGVPWDAPFLNHYRQLCVVNDPGAGGGSGTRKTYVDGYLVNAFTVAATTTTTPANATVTIGAALPGNVAECLVWNATVLTQAQIDAMLAVQRTKWEVPTLKAPIVTAAIPVLQATAATNVPAATVLVQATNVAPTGSVLPANCQIPSLRCWLDAAYPTRRVYNGKKKHPSTPVPCLRTRTTPSALCTRPPTGGCVCGATAAARAATPCSPRRGG